MGNCLKTQLKESVNNPNLIYFDAIKISVAESAGSSASRVFHVAPKNLINIKVIGDGKIQTSAALLNSDPKTELTINDNHTYIYSTDANIILKCGSIDNIDSIELPNSGYGNKCSINIDELKYCNSLTKLVLSQSLSVGNISSLTSIYLTRIEVGDTQISGDIENFVSTQFDAGRESIQSPIYLRTSLRNLNFGGNTHNVTGAHLLWDSKEKINIHYGDSDFANCTTVLERGYNTTEIKVWTDAGKTVTDVVSGTVYPPTNA